MEKLNGLHMDIAKILIECAKNKTTICYSDLCERLRISRRNIGKELEQVSLLAHENYGIFISVLVVLKETQNEKNPTPSSGFYEMYRDICGIPSDFEEAIRIQREKAFEQDWSNLPELMRKEIKK